MSVRYREDKATQAAARLMKHEGGGMNILKLIKLLYLTDRTALARWGRPLSFDWYYSLPHGPVLSLTLNRLNEQPDPSEMSYWHSIISERRGYGVTLLGGVPNDQLSPAEEGLLDEVYGQFGGMNEWQLRDYTHTLPEYQDPKGSRLPIEVREILLAQGLSEEDALEVEEALKAESSADHLLAD